MKKTIRIKHAIERYSISRSSIYRLIEQGAITRHKVGGCAMLSVQELDNLFSPAQAA